LPIRAVKGTIPSLVAKDQDSTQFRHAFERPMVFSPNIDADNIPYMPRSDLGVDNIDRSSFLYAHGYRNSKDYRDIDVPSAFISLLPTLNQNNKEQKLCLNSLCIGNDYANSRYELGGSSSNRNIVLLMRYPGMSKTIANYFQSVLEDKNVNIDELLMEDCQSHASGPNPCTICDQANYLFSQILNCNNNIGLSEYDGIRCALISAVAIRNKVKFNAAPTITQRPYGADYNELMGVPGMKPWIARNIQTTISQDPSFQGMDAISALSGPIGKLVLMYSYWLYDKILANCLVSPYDCSDLLAAVLSAVSIKSVNEIENGPGGGLNRVPS
jgi:hypothetical protein